MMSVERVMRDRWYYVVKKTGGGSYRFDFPVEGAESIGFAGDRMVFEVRYSDGRVVEYGPVEQADDDSLWRSAAACCYPDEPAEALG